MQPATRFAAPLFSVALALIPALPVHSQTPGPFVCMTRDFTKRIGYVSRIFNLPAADGPKANTAWHQMLTAQYGITALPYQSCQGPYPSAAVADTMRTKFITMVETTLKQKVLQLEWTYNGAAPVVVAAAPPPPPPVAPPPPGALTPAQRQIAEGELPQSRAYCQQNLRGLFDCDKFAQSVLRHRLAHPEEWLHTRDGDGFVTVHDLHAGIVYKLECTECVDEAMQTAWARKSVADGMSQQLMGGRITQAQVDKYADCVAKGFAAKFRADPYIHKVQAQMNDARISCGNPRG